MSRYVINTSQDNTGVAPREFQWSAWFGDYDDGRCVAVGATEEEAIVDLVTNYDLEPEPHIEEPPQ